MDRIKLTVAFDGTAYVGWQLQPNGVSVQQRLEDALLQLTGTHHRIHSSGRTDAGVHARGMVCHFDSPRDLPLSAWREGLNRFLPDDIAVRHAEKVASEFHARFSARGKHYRYTLLRDAVRSPLDRHLSWRVPPEIDLQRMQQAAAAFVGRHDFSAFRSSGCAARSPEKEIYSVTLTAVDSLVHIDIRGSGFLRHMVRMMVGTLVEVGRGKRPVAIIEQMLADPRGTLPPLTAPAQGLCLMEVCY
ncbi:MAG: tRNA pseudouridine(38-40) synthase TruA [Pelovirga sp.]